MPKLKEQEKPLLSRNERESIQEQMEASKVMLSASKDYGEDDMDPAEGEGFIINKEAIRKKIAHLQSILDERTPVKVTDGAKRDKIERRRSELVGLFRVILETWQDIYARNVQSPEYIQALKKAKARPPFEPLIAEWKRLGQMLDPDDPGMTDLDTLRENR